MKGPEFLKKAENSLQHMLYPPRCPVCDGILTEEGGICEECVPELRRMEEPRCYVCGVTLESGERELCGNCEKHVHVFRRGLPMYEYASVRESIYRFKYKGRAEYANYFGRDVAKHLGRAILHWEPDALIPIPLHKKKERARGYNQAALLAEVLGRELEVPVWNDVLTRERYTRPMKELNARERQINLKKAFHIAQDVVKSKIIVLVDDIYTTGSTLDTAAATLLEAGAQEVYFVTLSIGVI